jgi:hypothetical protein
MLQANSRLGLVSCLADQIDAQGAVIGREFALLDERSQEVFSNYTMPAPASSYTGRRELFAQFPFRPALDLAEDYDFVSRVAEVSAIRGVPEVLLQYRHHGCQGTRELASEQILRACIVRLMTARRRHRRDEDFAVTLADVGPWLHAAPDKAAIYSRFATWCLRDGFASLAVYHARKLLSVQRDAAAMKTAFGVYAAALRMAPREAVLLSRLFFTGPLRTHGLHPG